ncbi:phosphoribosylformylglycinamidine synthase I [bacterium]|nr:phosphoribosylformylglycinamidine synthase I [bacterium]
MKSPSVAIIQFPGSNCEYETLRAANRYGFSGQIVRWNEAEQVLNAFDAYILPGGFSYQDRVRAGAIAAKLGTLEVVARAAKEGRPVLGICNGCQIISEAGLVTGQAHIDVALAPNTRNGAPVGFICDWKYVRVVNPQKSPFTRYFDESDVLPIPINHGEGRFVISETAKSDVDGLASFRYCDDQGRISDAFPVTPNGAYLGIAGLSSKEGNVFAIMPHPERAAELKQIPVSVKGPWGGKKRDVFRLGLEANGPWEKLFVGFREFCGERA